jgi:hypothetical protein
MQATPDTSLPSDSTLVAAAAFNAAATASAPRTFLGDALVHLAGLLDINSCAILVQGESGLRCAGAIGLLDEYASLVEQAELGRFCPDAWAAGSCAIDDLAALAAPNHWSAAMLAYGFRSCWSVALRVADGRVLGAFVAYGRAPGCPGQDKLALASAYASIVALGLDRLDRESSLAARYHAVVVALTTALDARDDYTGRHSSETSVLAVDVGRRLRMDETQLELLSQVAVLHDVGKLGISTEVLVKQAR